MNILQKRPTINLVTMTSIIVPGSNKVLNIFSQNNEIVIPWQNIKCIGDDLILVEI